MRLDPVFLVAPEAAPPSMPTRRAFLMTGGAFVVGAAAGGACGYSVGVAAAPSRAVGTDAPVSPAASGEGGEVTWEPSNDADLEELRRLAVKAPLDELFEKAVLFLSVRAKDYKTDKILWRGVGRMAADIAQNPNRKVPHTTISIVIGLIERASPPEDLQLPKWLPMLRSRRDEAKRGK